MFIGYAWDAVGICPECGGYLFESLDGIECDTCDYKLNEN